MAYSILAFDEMRNYTGFRRPAGKTVEEDVKESLSEAVSEFLESWRARQGRALLVRYEDLVTQPAQTLAAALEYLGVDASSSTVDEMMAASRSAEEQFR